MYSMCVRGEINYDRYQVENMFISTRIIISMGDTLHSYTCYVCALRVDAIIFSARLEGPPEAERTTKCERSEPPLNVNGNFISPLYNIIYIALGELRGVLHRRFCQPARCAFIFTLRNITLGGYLDTCRTFTAHGMAF